MVMRNLLYMEEAKKRKTEERRRKGVRAGGRKGMGTIWYDGKRVERACNDGKGIGIVWCDGIGMGGILV